MFVELPVFLEALITSTLHTELPASLCSLEEVRPCWEDPCQTGTSNLAPKEAD